ncbi:MAG: HPP family protein [Actinomycetales bacterium]|jgi:hypothetical protein
MGAPSDSRGAVIWRVVAGTAITTTILGLAAAGLAEPLIFPSLGPTIFLLLFLPLNVMSAPRNVIAGHGIGMASGYLALVLFGLLWTPPDLFDLSLTRVGAIVFALCLAFTLMIWWGVPHAPAAATALIVALGILRTPLDLAVMMSAVVTVVLCSFAVNRIARIPAPVWSPPKA